jgi:rhamnulokinase
MLDPRTGRWARTLVERFDLPAKILGDLVPPGTRLGPLLPAVAEEAGLGGIDVVVPGTHDTASAVMAVPAAAPSGERPDWCYISSGTWSLMGVEIPQPVINDTCRQLNFTNEGGVGGTVRLLKNIGGLWLVQECRRIWNQGGGNFDWETLNQLSAEAAPLVSVIDPDDPGFTAPADMPAAIREFCRRTGQVVPESEGAVVRCALEGLALKYRQVLGWLEQLIGGRIETIHIVGGGTRNRQLCQMAADACGRRVLAGPVEATAIGNVMMQAVAAGEVGSIAQARSVIGNSFDVQEYLPSLAAPYDEAFARFASF